MDQRRIAADKIHTNSTRRLVDYSSELHWIAARAFGDHRNGCDRDSLISHPDTKLIADLIDCLNQAVGVAMTGSARGAAARR